MLSWHCSKLSLHLRRFSMEILASMLQVGPHSTHLLRVTQGGCVAGSHRAVRFWVLTSLPAEFAPRSQVRYLLL